MAIRSKDIIFTGEPIQIKSLPRLKKGETRKLKKNYLNTKIQMR